MIITADLLNKNPDWIFVFGDNTLRRGLGGAAKLRYHPQSYGFITKKKPDYQDSSFYTIEEYQEVFLKEMEKLMAFIQRNPNKIFMISKIGAGLANKHGIYEAIIRKGLEFLTAYGNVKLL